MVSTTTGIPAFGSSPRLWGTLKGTACYSLPWRFIPTAVGNAGTFPFLMVLPAVHPHGCGERWYDPSNHDQFFGSSPRLWGTRPLVHAWQEEYRFIPTAVGNASTGALIKIHTLVHPHGCGERYVVVGTMTAGAGSSPRLWGTPTRMREAGRLRRFIPTAVGNAALSDMPPRKARVHPHGCGERGAVSYFQQRRAGSSPRLWGTH